MMSSPAESCITEEDEDEDDEDGKKKKSFRFNEIVQRQVYRSNSSILGQKVKNQKKAEQKRRKAARRASEGDLPSSFNSCEMDESETDNTNDSGVASSMDEANETVKETKKPIENKKAETLLKK